MKTDIAIIGAGPVGLFAVFQCGMLGLKSCVIDVLPEIGGQCNAMYPEKPIYDIPGFPEITAGDLISNLEKQASPFSPEYLLGQKAEGINKTDKGWKVTTSSGNEIFAKAVIIAAGSGAFGPNRPPLSGIEDYEGKSVYYMVRHRKEMAGKRIVIAGGGDSAVDWAVSLHDIAEKIYVVHRRDKFRAVPDMVSRLKTFAEGNKLELVTPYQLSSLDGNNGQIETVTVSCMEDGSERQIEADALLAFFGLKTNLSEMESWGLAMENGKIPTVNSICATHLPGVYAAGDIVEYKDKLKLILTGFSEAAMAAHSAHKFINPDTETHFEYSTSKGVPGKN